MNLELDKIKSLPPEEAIEILSRHLQQNPEDDEALTMRGMKHWALNQRQLAINDYLRAIRINPHSKARMALEFANSILDYYNKDLLNP
ncbi:MAG: hypothetical protein J1E78_04030 [Muribaculaceae bacterium]|nr:hypothetical protein [Muribaculaceae bacterium]